MPLLPLPHSEWLYLKGKIGDIMDNLFVLILGMAAVTYIPRALPLVALSGINMPRFVKRFLENIPYAVLGALIFPGILTSVPDYRLGIAGGLAAVLLSWLGLNLVIVVAGSISVLYALQSIF